MANSRLGHHDRAIALSEKLVSLSGRAPLYLGLLGLGLAAAGKTSDARALLDELRTRSAHEYVPANILVLIQVGLGHRDEICAGILTAMDQRVNGLGLETFERWRTGSVPSDVCTN